MYVPEHITATGDAIRYNEVANKRVPARVSLLEQMEVPDRITVTGGDTYGRINDDFNRDIEIPTEYNNAMNDVPQMLTVADTAYNEDNYQNQIETARTDNSIVVNEDPLRELKILRRQMGRISARVFYLEEQNERRKARENFFILAFLGIAATTIWSIFKR